MTSAYSAFAGVASGVAALDIRGLTKGFTTTGGERFLAVDGIDLTVQPGEVVAFLGPNGAGKSTTIDMILGLTRPDAGRVQVLGLTPEDAVRSGRVAAVMQSGGLLPALTVQATVDVIASLFPGADSEEVIRRAGLDEVRQRTVSTCSGGQQQSLRFALALLSDPDLLILDEPTAGMDVDARRRFWADVRADAARGATVLFATHYLDEADHFADRVVMVARGRVVADGTTAEVRARTSGRAVSAVVSRAGADAALHTVPGTRIVEIRGDRTVFATHRHGSPGKASSDDLVRFLLTRTDARELEAVSLGLEEVFVQLTADGEVAR